MPTYSDEVNVYNPNAIKDGMVDARDYYVTSVTNDGIWVTPHDKKPVNGAAASTTRGWHIADALEYFRGTVRYIKAWLNGSTPTVRLGQDSSGHADVTPSGLEVFTNASTSVASFGSTARIGKDGGRRVDVKADGMTFYGNDNDPYFKVIDYPGTGNYSDETYVYTGDGTKKRFALPKVSTLYNVTVTNGTAGTVTKNSTYFEFSTAPVSGANIQVQARFYDGAAKAYTLGVRGGDESSIGMYSVAEGFNTIAVGNFSRAQNLETIARGEAQTVIGKFNVEDANNVYAFIIGNGTADNARSNALAVRKDGNIECAEDTDWTTLNSTIKYRIHHGVCYVVGLSTNVTQVATGGTVVGTLPTGARPTIDVEGAATTMGNNCGQWKVGTSGQITVWGFGSATKYWAFTASYPL